MSPSVFLKRARERTRTAVLVKGNPYYVEGAQKDLADSFYKKITDRLESRGFIVTHDRGDPYTSPDAADVWIGHSRGEDRLRFAPKRTRTVYLSDLMGEKVEPGIADIPEEDRPLPGKSHYYFRRAVRDYLDKL
jgi:hypothetical protein